MQKIIKPFVLILMAISTILFHGFSNTAAQTNQAVIHKTKYYLGSNAHNYDNFGYKVTINNETVFCLDPKVLVDVNAHYQADQHSSAIDPMVQKIAYFGYYYPKHQASETFKKDPDAFYINTQAMIWEHLGYQVKLNTPNYASFKKAVQKQINNFHQVVSFHQKVIKTTKDEVVLEDQNHVLKDYHILNNLDNLHMQIKDNKLYIKIHDFKTFNQVTINQQLQKYYPYAKINILYHAKKSQTLARLGFVEQVNSQFVLQKQQEYQKVEFIKQDEQHQLVKNASLALYHHNKLVQKWNSNEAKTLKLIKGETYQLVELKAPDGYDYAKKMTFKVDDNLKQVVMVDHQIKGAIQIIKQNRNHQNLVGAQFEVIDLTTNQSLGMFTSVKIINNLDVTHQYRIIERQAPNGYLLGHYQNGQLINSKTVRFDFKKVQDFNSQNNQITQKVVMIDDQKVVNKKVVSKQQQEIVSCNDQQTNRLVQWFIRLFKHVFNAL